MNRGHGKAFWGISRRYILHVAGSAFTDVLIVFASYTVAFSARAVITPLEFLNGAKLIILAAVILVGIFYLFGVYKRIWSQTSGHGMTVLVNATILGTLLIVLFDIVPEQRPLPLSIVILGNLLSLSGFIAIRYRSRLLSGASWRWQAVWNNKFPKVSTRVLIVGSGQSGQEVAVRLKHRTRQHNYTVVGFIDDDPEKRNMYVEGCQVLGNRNDIEPIVSTHNIDLIVVAIHNISGPDFRDILSHCEDTEARIKVVPDVTALMDANQKVDFLRDVQAEDLLGRGVISKHENVDLSAIVDKVILVTGAAGSIGSELCRQLPTYGPNKLILFDSNESGLHDLTIELTAKFPHTSFVQVLGDITVSEAIQPIFAQYQPRIVFHAAAYKHVPILQAFPNEAVRVNIGGTHLVAGLAQAYGVERFVLISTDKAVNPLSVMGASKRVCELLMKAFSQQPDNHTLFTSVRFGNVLGSRGSVVTTFNQQISNGGPVTITHKEMTRYFMTIPEAVNLVIHAACLTNGGEIFLLKMGEVVRIVDLAERMMRLRGLRPYKDIEIKFTGMRPGEKLHEQLYDGAAVDAVETLHPGIIQLNGHHDAEFDGAALLQWVSDLLKNGIGSNQDALSQLLWGMTPSELYAILAQASPPGEGILFYPRPDSEKSAPAATVSPSNANGSRVPGQSAAV